MLVKRTAVAVATVSVTGIIAAGAAASNPVHVQVVARGLNAPKHMVYTSRGLYVVESGAGGPKGTSNCVSGAAAQGAGTNEYCIGRTGSVALLRGRRIRTVASRLASEVNLTTGEVSGPSGVAVSRFGGLSVLYQDTHVNSAGVNTVPGAAKRVFGTLQLPGGRAVNIAKFDSQHPQNSTTLGGTPGETTYDSDPYDVIPYRRGYVVTDAAANSLLYVTQRGAISVLARFPTQAETVPAGVFGPQPVTIDAQAVPTSVAVGRDGALYVGILRGVPSLPGTAEIFRVVPGRPLTVWARGLTAVTAIAFDPRGRLLATELSTGGLLAPPKVPGALVRISANGRQVSTLPVAGLFDPTGVAVAPNGTVWVANYGTHTGSAPQSGEVLQITGLK